MSSSIRLLLPGHRLEYYYEGAPQTRVPGFRMEAQFGPDVVLRRL